MDGEVFKYELDLQLLFAIQLTGNNAEGASVTFCISTESRFLSSELHWVGHSNNPNLHFFCLSFQACQVSSLFIVLGL